MSEYPCAPIEGVAPIFVPHMLKGAMALRYMRFANCTYEEGVMHAIATWDTDWESDPEPRTFDLAKQAVDDDLECWEGD